MPLYVYKAIDKSGNIVRNKVEDTSKNSLLYKLKRNELTPIEIVELKGRRNKTNKNKRNIKNIDDILKNLNSGELVNTRKKKKNILNTSIGNQKITSRDLIVFSQNFYLLKKADFNNIHALTTIIESTENERFKEILEDILAGVEAGENMYQTMEYYPEVFPYIYILI